MLPVLLQAAGLHVVSTMLPLGSTIDCALAAAPLDLPDCFVCDVGWPCLLQCIPAPVCVRACVCICVCVCVCASVCVFVFVFAVFFCVCLSLFVSVWVCLCVRVKIIIIITYQPYCDHQILLPFVSY